MDRQPRIASAMRPTTTGPSRRTVLTGVAWAVPAVTMTSVAPAFAASGARTLTVFNAKSQVVAGTATTVTGTLLDAGVTPVSGASVSFSGPSGMSISPRSATTNGSGVAQTSVTVTDTFTTPGSSVTVTGVATGGGSTATASGGFTVVGANGYGYYPGQPSNTYRGEAGTGSTVPNTPTQLLRVFPSPVVAAATGQGFSLVALEDGTVWGVGLNNIGQLGDGTTTNRRAWVKISNLSNITGVACGASMGYALSSDGRVFGWGENNLGQLGDGTTRNSLTPVQVSGISTATQITSAAYGACALLADGTVLTWGYGITTADGAGRNQSTPVAASNLSDVRAISAGDLMAFALLNSGEIRTWGSNDEGRLGVGVVGGGSSQVPVPVADVSDAVRVAGGRAMGTALLRDGTVKTWGSNFNNQLGLGPGSASYMWSPVPIPDLSGVSSIFGGLGITWAIIGSGDIRQWGDGVSPSPTALSGTTGVSFVGCGPVGRHGIMVR